METLKGLPVANAINEKIIEEMKDWKGAIPHLAIVRVGERPDDMSYERGATKKMEKVGFRCTSYTFPADIDNDTFQKEFDKINEDEDIDGILLLRPLPKHLDEKAIENRIASVKDLDGISPMNLAKVYAGDPTGYGPCTAEAVIEMLDYAGVDLKGKRAVVIGRSLVIGKPVAMMLNEADVIIYAGSLVNEELLEYAKKDCEIYNSAYMNLDEVINVIVKAESEGKNIVRLHTGDPSLYGAIREQIEELAKHGITCEICPGVSSFLAAAAAMNCEYTVPEVAQSVIITRMPGRTPVPDNESIAKLAAHGTSMVIFLSSSHLKELKEELYKGAYTPDTPCAICYKASWKDEKCIKTTLENLDREAEKAGITKTALIMVGEFLGDKYSFSKLYDPEFTTEYRK